MQPFTATDRRKLERDVWRGIVSESWTRPKHVTSFTRQLPTMLRMRRRLRHPSPAAAADSPSPSWCRPGSRPHAVIGQSGSVAGDRTRAACGWRDGRPRGQAGRLARAQSGQSGRLGDASLFVQVSAAMGRCPAYRIGFVPNWTRNAEFWPKSPNSLYRSPTRD